MPSKPVMTGRYSPLPTRPIGPGLIARRLAPAGAAARARGGTRLAPGLGSEPEPSDVAEPPPGQDLRVPHAVLGGPAHDQAGEVPAAVVVPDPRQGDRRPLGREPGAVELQVIAVPEGRQPVPVTPADPPDAVLAGQVEVGAGRPDQGAP